MNDPKDTVSVEEAKSVLEQLSHIEKEANAVIRPPFWLTLVISFSYGMMTFTWASTRHENLWMLGFIVSTICFLLSVIFYFYTSRLLGIQPKLTPKSITELKFNIITALFFGVVFTLSRTFSLDGIWWAAYIGGILNTSALAFLLHNFSNGSFAMSTTSNDKK